MSRVVAVEKMDRASQKMALARSRVWLRLKWDTADIQTLDERLLRHAELLEALD